MNNDTDTTDTVAPQSADSAEEFRALQAVIAALHPLQPEARQRIYESAGTFLKMAESRRPSDAKPTHGSSLAAAPARYSEDTSMSAKEFLLEKQPRTDVERVACLAYYLTHYAGMPHFKTLDLSKLNTEAAQPKFANAANSVNNAVKRGYLVPSTKGQRQLSAAGEQFVRVLPDREAARQAMGTSRPRRRLKRATATTPRQPGQSA